MDRWAVQDLAIHAELRSMARTIPAALERIPMQMAAQMGTGRRTGMQRAGLVSIGCDLLEALADDRPMAGLDLVVCGHVTRRDIFGEILDRRNVLADEG